MDREPPISNLVLAGRMQPPLSSWSEGRAKNAIIDFVERVTCKGSPHYVRRPERIAVFDTDGTLWPERPVYIQAAFAIDRIKLLATQHAKWTEAPLAQAIIAGDIEKLSTASERRTQEILAWTHAGLSADNFEKIIVSWLLTAKHSTFGRRYTELQYRPMQELLAYLRINGFKVFAVSCGSVEFVRVFAEQTYDIPPEQVIGSAIVTRLEFEDGKPLLVKQSRIEGFDDGVGKPSGIRRFVGRRPIFAIGNSDGDQQMLQWVAANDGVRFVGLLRHTDPVREFEYGGNWRIGPPARVLLEARERNWTVVDMAKDWLRVFSERERESP